MKTLLLSAAAALALAGPVFADAQSFARQHFAQSEEGGDGVRHTGPTRPGDLAFAIAHFAQSEDGDGARARDTAAEARGLILSTSNAGQTAFARAKLDNGERGDN